jgi:osmotically inducible protein OsmC
MPQHSTATAHWNRSLLEGEGTVSTTSPAIDSAPLVWKARIGDQAGTTPEELLAAAHAGCYAMALSGALSKDGHEPVGLDVEATYSFGPSDGGFGISGVALTVRGDVPDLDVATFVAAAEGAKTGCPVSKAIAGNVPITLTAQLTTNA